MSRSAWLLPVLAFMVTTTPREKPLPWRPSYMADGRGSPGRGRKGKIKPAKRGGAQGGKRR